MSNRKVLSISLVTQAMKQAKQKHVSMFKEDLAISIELKKALAAMNKVQWIVNDRLIAIALKILPNVPK